MFIPVTEFAIYKGIKLIATQNDKITLNYIYKSLVS